MSIGRTLLSKEATNWNSSSLGSRYWEKASPPWKVELAVEPRGLPVEHRGEPPLTAPTIGLTDPRSKAGAGELGFLPTLA